MRKHRRTHRRTRKESELDKRDRLARLAEHNPAASAARQFVHKAYQNYTVDSYMKSRGKKEIES